MLTFHQMVRLNDINTVSKLTPPMPAFPPQQLQNLPVISLLTSLSS